MPVFYTSYRDDTITRQIEALVGKPYSLWAQLRMGGTGCRRMQITAQSENLNPYLNDPLYPSFGSLELRPQGLLVHLARNVQRYVWPIPYTDLVVTGGTEIRIESAEGFVVFQDKKRDNQQFIQRLALAAGGVSIG